MKKPLYVILSTSKYKNVAVFQGKNTVIFVYSKEFGFVQNFSHYIHTQKIIYMKFRVFERQGFSRKNIH